MGVSCVSVSWSNSAPSHVELTHLKWAGAGPQPALESAPQVGGQSSWGFK